MPVYPDNQLRIGQQDPPFGGAASDDYGGPAWAFHDGVIQESEKELIATYWSPFAQRKMLCTSAGLPGDFFFEYLSGSTSTYTLLTAAGLALITVPYNADSTPRVGMLAEPVSAANQALIILQGPGIPTAIHGLGAGPAGYVRMNVFTGRLERADGSVGEKIVGTINLNGMVRLTPAVPGLIE